MGFSSAGSWSPWLAWITKKGAGSTEYGVRERGTFRGMRRGGHPRRTWSARLARDKTRPLQYGEKIPYGRRGLSASQPRGKPYPTRRGAIGYSHRGMVNVTTGHLIASRGGESALGPRLHVTYVRPGLASGLRRRRRSSRPLDGRGRRAAPAGSLITRSLSWASRNGPAAPFGFNHDEAPRRPRVPSPGKRRSHYLAVDPHLSTVPPLRRSHAGSSLRHRLRPTHPRGPRRASPLPRSLP